MSEIHLLFDLDRCIHQKHGLLFGATLMQVPLFILLGQLWQKLVRTLKIGLGQLQYWSSNTHLLPQTKP